MGSPESHREFEAHQRADGMDVADNGGDGGRPVAVTFHPNVMGPHVADRRRVPNIGMFGRLDLEVTQARPPFVHPAV